MSEIRDSDIYREILDPAEDAHLDQQPEPDADSLRAAFLAYPHFAHRRAGDPTLRRCLLVIAGSITWAALILLIVWVVTG